MKKLLLISLLGLISFNQVCADEIEISVEKIDNKPLSDIPMKSPVRPINVDLTNGILTFVNGNYCDYALILLDEDDEVAYAAAVPAGTSTVVFPSWLQGNYKLCLVPDNSAYYYYGYIVL